MALDRSDSPPPNHGPSLSIRFLAARWECSMDTVRRRIRSGDLVIFRLGNRVRIPLAEVTRYEQKTIKN